MSILKTALFLICIINMSFGEICETKQNCQDCIQEFDCEWCTEPLDTTGKHCRSKNSSSKWCDRSKLFPKNSTYENIQDDEFNRMIQMKPQRVKLSLRKGQRVNLNFQFQTAVNYPVDLYYLMDLSQSMGEYKTKLAKLGIQLTSTMKNLTKNFMIGFGSFSDKVFLPFTSTVPSKLEFPCEKKYTKCASPYAFKIILPLSNDYDSFVTNVNVSNTTANIDNPEGGFDAIMQTIVCKEKIKWRDQARHLLVFATDAPFHIAGDGKLGGMVEPNPGRCYEDEKDYLIYDYPSVSHINYVAKENNINIIFAIVPKPSTKEPYRSLSNNIENSKYGQLNDNDDSVIKLVVDNYNKIVQSVKFTSNATEELDIQFSSYCNGPVKSDRCNDVTIGKVVKFKATIQLRQCPKDGEKTKIISIRPESLNESLIIELELQCDCPCSTKDDITFKPNSRKCSGIGNFTCGICSCPEGRFGVYCECDTTKKKSEDVTNCIKEGTTEVCSGSGACNTCGKCECNVIPNNQGQNYSGEFCECNNFSCKREGGLLCSGQGKCNCNKCECNQGFSGDACDCDLATTNCRAGDSDSICSGNGECVCNRCQCEMKDNNIYSGKLCEDCTTCPAQRCEKLRPCVECQVYRTGIYKDTCHTKCTAFRTDKIHTLVNEENNEYKKCKIPDNEACIINFEYSYGSDDKLIVRALDRKICPEPPNVLAWILGVIATILIAGLIILIIWKILTTIHDQREYAKFENQQKNLKWSTQDNPLFKDATSTFSNPAYKRVSVRFSIRKD